MLKKVNNRTNIDHKTYISLRVSYIMVRAVITLELDAEEVYELIQLLEYCDDYSKAEKYIKALQETT